MKFEWDPEKEKANKRKHGFTFTEACYVFSDRYALTIFDPDHSKDEDRWITIGQGLVSKTLTVVHTYRLTKDGESVRIISARKATEVESRQYLEGRR